MNRRDKGFTLMELMVVIVIVAILAAVAVPLYVNYVKDAQRTEAKGAIGAVITAEQTFYQLNGQYTTDKFIQNPGLPANTGKQILNCDLTDALTNWSISVTSADANSFTVVATGQGATAGRSVTLNYSRTSPLQWQEN